LLQLVQAGQTYSGKQIVVFVTKIPPRWGAKSNTELELELDNNEADISIHWAISIHWKTRIDVATLMLRIRLTLVALVHVYESLYKSLDSCPGCLEHH
jgi:hypothetical protein